MLSLRAYLESHSGAAVCFQVCAWTSRRASGTFLGPKPNRTPSGFSCSELLSEARADETVVCGLCPDSQRAVKAAFKFTLLSPQRAEGKRGHGREEAPPAPPTLTPPSPGNRLGRHGLLSLFKTLSSPSTSRGFACFTQL